MKIVGLTGGIGSGKSTIATMFSALGVPIYIADTEAKQLMITSKVIRRKLIGLLGENAYRGAALNREFIAKKIFNNTELLENVNAIVHPKVASHFKRWLKKQNGPYCIKEVAILFENGGYKYCDYTILITAPFEARIERVSKRDRTDRQSIENRMGNQWSDEKKSVLADVIIENIELKATQKKVKKIHLFLSKR